MPRDKFERLPDLDAKHNELHRRCYETPYRMAFGEISVVNATTELTITTQYAVGKIQITAFDTNGLSDNTTPDHTQDHITVNRTAKYLCVASLHVESAAAGGADTFGFSVYKNNGATEFSNLHAHRKLAGGGGDVGSVSISGIVELNKDDTIELWCWNEDSTDNIVVKDITLSILEIGI